MGLGNNNNPPDGDQSRIYVTALTATTLFVDYNNDGTVDANFPISPLVETPITDPDHDLTGAFLFTDDGTPFVAVWGQDESADPLLFRLLTWASASSPALADPPKSFPAHQGRGLHRHGNSPVIRFVLGYSFLTNSADPLSNILVEDTLPSSVTYIPNSTAAQWLTIPDAGATAFPLDEGGYNVGTA